MEYYSIFGLAFYIIPCLLPIFVIGAVVFVLYRWRTSKKVGYIRNGSHLIRYFDIATSQISIALAVLFFLYFLFSITKQLNVDIEAHYVAFFGLIIGFVLTYRLTQQLLLFFSIIAAYIWWIWFAIFEISNVYKMAGETYYGGYSDEHRPLIIIIGLLILSLLFFLLGRIHSQRKGYKYFYIFYYLWAIIPPSIMLLLVSNKFVLVEAIPSLLEGNAFLMPPLLIVTMILMCLSIVFLAFYSYFKNIADEKYLISIVSTLLGIGVLLFVPKMDLGSDNTSFSYMDSSPNFLGYIFLIFFNLLIFGEFLLLILYGYIKKNIAFITLGTILLFFLCIEKYIEWFSFTEKGLFFTGAGVLMLGLGFVLERARRSIINNLNSNQSSTGIDGKQ